MGARGIGVEDEAAASAASASAGGGSGATLDDGILTKRRLPTGDRASPDCPNRTLDELATALSEKQIVGTSQQMPRSLRRGTRGGL